MSTLDLVAEKLEGAKNYGKYIASLCPFHNDKRPSFFVYEDTYRCLACGAHGSTASLIHKLSNVPDKVRIFNEPQSRNPFTGWIAKWGLHGCVDIGYRNLEKNPSHYLQSRGIDIECQNSLRIGILDGFLIFPIFNHWQELVGAVARVGENNTSTSKYYLPKNQDSKLLYVPSWERIKEHEEVFVTFGIIDAISLYCMGYASASTTTGQSVSVEAFERIRKRIIFIPDKLEEESALKIAAKLSWRGDVITLPYPLHTKDVNDIFRIDRNWIDEHMARFVRNRSRSNNTGSITI